MPSLIESFVACAALSNVFLASAAPFDRLVERQSTSSNNGEPIVNDAIPYDPVGPVGSTGNIYGSSELLGSNGDGATPQDAPVEQQVGDYTLVPGQTEDPDLGLYLDFTSNPNPQPIRGDTGGTDPGPRNEAIERQNSDLLARPGTDKGSLPNPKWPMGLSTNRPGTGGGDPGWARQENTQQLPIATAMAGVDMRLGPYAYRELHWHTANEWAYIFNGGARVSTVDQNGQAFVDDLVAGDLWFFPSGVPHSIQANGDGTEFLLIFDQGDFSEDGTDLVSELFLRNPKSVLAKNFQTDVSAFINIPQNQRYIFNGSPFQQSLEETRQSVTGPAGLMPQDMAYTYHLSGQAPLVVPGGTVKIVDPTTFPIANNFSMALFTIEPGAMREIHWHLTSDEWNFFIQGQGRVTVFEAPDTSNTFDFQAGDVGYIPVADSHYVENTGNETIIYMEVLQAPRYSDISAAQWLGLTPAQVVKETLNVDQDFIDKLPKTKRYIVPGNTNLTSTNFTVSEYPNAMQSSSGSSNSSSTVPSSSSSTSMMSQISTSMSQMSSSISTASTFTSSVVLSSATSQGSSVPTM